MLCDVMRVKKKNLVYYCLCGCYRHHTRGLTTLSYIYTKTEDVVYLCSRVFRTVVAAVTVDESVLFVAEAFLFDSDLYREKLSLESIGSDMCDGFL